MLFPQRGAGRFSTRKIVTRLFVSHAARIVSRRSGAAADRSGWLRAPGLSGGGARTELLEPLDHNIEIRITGAKLASDPVPAAFGDALAVRDDLELTGPAGSRHGVDADVLLDEGHETRDLSLVILSRWAIHDLDLHSLLRSVQYSPRGGGRMGIKPWAQ